MPRRLLILGSTGSIGTQALDLLGLQGDEFELVGLSAERSWEALVEQARRHGVDRIALADTDAAARAAEAWTDGEVLAGAEGLVRLVVESEADLVLNALVGSAGLGPTVATLGEGIDLALANKESLVVGGELVMQLAEATGAQILPVDSEHSALHQLMATERIGGPGSVVKLVLTASGGPFRGRSRAELEDVTRRGGAAPPDLGHGRQDHDRLRHADEQGPRADRGPPPLRDPVRATSTSSSTRSRSCTPTCCCATAPRWRTSAIPTCASRSPTRCTTPSASSCRCAPLDLADVGALDFEPVDLDAFPCLRLAREAAIAGGTAPCVLNAANEVAVHAFLGGPAGLHGDPGGDRGDPRAASASRPCAPSNRSTRPTARRARSPAS